jgi:hypothetical protein
MASRRDQNSLHIELGPIKATGVGWGIVALSCLVLVVLGFGIAFVARSPEILHLVGG